MLCYLSSGDFFRMCHDQSRELELETAGASEPEAREELRRASNVLTSFYDIQTDSMLRDAIRVHLNKFDQRWLMGHPGLPPTPPTTQRARTVHRNSRDDGVGWVNNQVTPTGAKNLEAVHEQLGRSNSCGVLPHPSRGNFP